MNQFVFDIDVVGACNLHCPSCPQGNIKNYRLPHGQMVPEQLVRILDKATSECSVKRINLFCWCEPLLHPRIHELIRIVQDRGIRCGMSSNLNILPDADAIMEADPSEFKISVSGFTQEVYGYTHRGGDIVRVKKHMVELAAAKKRHNATTRILVNFHRYRHNLKEEPIMKKFATDLDFDFEPAWALLLPIEKILGCSGDGCDTSFTDEDAQLVEHLALPFEKALDAARGIGAQSCKLIKEQVSLDFQGNVILCCGVFDASKFNLGNFLDIPMGEIQSIRQRHSMCEICKSKGGHVYLTYNVPKMDEMILKNISQEDSELLNLKHEIVQKWRKQRLQKIYQTYFSRIVSKEQKDIIKELLHRIFY